MNVTNGRYVHQVADLLRQAGYEINGDVLHDCLSRAALSTPSAGGEVTGHTPVSSRAVTMADLNKKGVQAAIKSGQAFANQVRAVTYKLHGQAYSSTVSALNQFDADLRRAHTALEAEGETCPTCDGTGKEGRHSICRDCDDTPTPAPREGGQ